jgi:hypothetical protein
VVREGGGVFGAKNGKTSREGSDFTNDMRGSSDLGSGGLIGVG